MDDENLEEELRLVDEILESVSRASQSNAFGEELNANSAPALLLIGQKKEEDQETQPSTNKPTPSIGCHSSVFPSIFQKSTAKKQYFSFGCGLTLKPSSDMDIHPVRTIGDSEEKRKNEGKMSPSLLEVVYNERTYVTKASKNSGFPTPVPNDPEAVKTWTYLRCKDFREYQFKMVETCLFSNTIVCLPTGLGKTFVATNVILNFYNWFPTGKIFFLAPTKPLVNQQINSVSSISQIKHEDFIELTGELSAKKRRLYYQEKRIFFMTPQTLENDLQEERLDPYRIVCVIYDEAHRAIGNYSYCTISAILDKLNIGLRVVALTATPGNDSSAIQEVITNLRVAKIEMRDETDPDVSQYIHTKRIEKVVIKATDYVKAIIDRLNRLVGKLLRNLVNSLTISDTGPINKAHPNYLGKVMVLKWMNDFSKRKDEYAMTIGPEMVSSVFEYFRMLLSLIGAKKVAMEQGLDALGNNIKKFREDSRNHRGEIIVSRKTIVDTEDFKFLEKFTVEGTYNRENHPKLEKLQQILFKFFEKEQSMQDNSKVIVFTNNRASALEIQDCLENVPGVRSTIFVGQNTSNMKKHRGLTQKEQLDILEKFKQNFYNVIIATCIGEEGLDIGEVDLIVCYDSGFSPIRMVQRMGRTGRRRAGKVIFLLMDGKEHFQFLNSMKKSDLLKRYLKDQSVSEEGNKKSRAIEMLRKKKDFKNLIFYSFNPRMLPEETTPALKFYYQATSVASEESEIDSEEEDLFAKEEEMKKPVSKPIIIKEASERDEECSYLEEIDFAEIDRIINEHSQQNVLQQLKQVKSSEKKTAGKRKEPEFERHLSIFEGGKEQVEKQVSGMKKLTEDVKQYIEVEEDKQTLDIFSYAYASNQKQRQQTTSNSNKVSPDNNVHMSSTPFKWKP